MDGRKKVEKHRLYMLITLVITVIVLFTTFIYDDNYY